MDDYLSKPLKQNQLIQTILRCATLGGALLERKNAEIRQARQVGIEGVNDTPESSPSSTPQKPTPKGRRPGLDVRGFTEAGPSDMASPSLLAADQSDPMDRVSFVYAQKTSLRDLRDTC